MSWFGGNSEKRLEDTMFQLRFSSKQMERLSKKAEKEEKIQKEKVKKALVAGNVDGAKIYAENSIRKKSEYLSYLRMASKLDGVQSQIQSAVAMKGITRNMSQVVKGLDKALNSMDLEKVSSVMEQFETQLDEIGIRTAVMEDSMSQATITSTPKDQVESLIQQVAEEAGLDVVSQLNDAQSVPSGALSTTGQRTQEQEDSLMKRLAALRE